MEFKIEKVFERDVDLMMSNQFLCNEKIKNYFLNKVGLSKYNVVEIEHSYMDEDGESDITIILENEKREKVAFLIEDKIDAIAMPNQCKRYDIRGQKGITSGRYLKYFVFIIAPEDYLNTNIEAQNYSNKISYETLLEILKEDIYCKCILEKALEEKKSGYIVIENKAITDFWNKYYDYIEKYHQDIIINKISGPRGNKACWPTFRTFMKNVIIIQKSDRGYLDLELGKTGMYYDIVENYFSKFISGDMFFVKTGKSISIRTIIPKIDFTSNFDDNIREIIFVLSKVKKFYELLKKVNINNLYSKIELEKRG